MGEIGSLFENQKWHQVEYKRRALVIGFELTRHLVPSRNEKGDGREALHGGEELQFHV